MQKLNHYVLSKHQNMKKFSKKIFKKTKIFDYFVIYYIKIHI